MLMLHYWTPENVKSDDEIQSWLCDLHDNGLPCWTQTEDHGVPEDFKTVDDLIEFVTIIVYTASGHNAALTGMVAGCTLKTEDFHGAYSWFSVCRLPV